jgi:hypothetical protein
MPNARGIIPRHESRVKKLGLDANRNESESVAFDVIIRVNLKLHNTSGMTNNVQKKNRYLIRRGVPSQAHEMQNRLQKSCVELMKAPLPIGFQKDTHP